MIKTQNYGKKSINFDTAFCTGILDWHNDERLTHSDHEAFYMCVHNDKSRHSLYDLIKMKSIISKQLPRMPKDYVCRLLFDPRHECLLVKDIMTTQVIGGICYRVFADRRFAEIAFLAISGEHQVKVVLV